MPVGSGIPYEGYQRLKSPSTLIYQALGCCGGVANLLKHANSSTPTLSSILLLYDLLLLLTPFNYILKKIKIKNWIYIIIINIKFI